MSKVGVGDVEILGGIAVAAVVGVAVYGLVKVLGKGVGAAVEAASGVAAVVHDDPQGSTQRATTGTLDFVWGFFDGAWKFLGVPTDAEIRAKEAAQDAQVPDGTGTTAGFQEYNSAASASFYASRAASVLP